MVVTLPGRHAIALAAALPDDLRTALHARHECVEHRPPARLAGVHVAVTTGMAGANTALFDSLPDLALLVSQGAGLDRIDTVEAERRGIAVAHTPDIFTQDVAEYAVALMLAALRRVVSADRFVRAGAWPTTRMRPATRVAGRRLGIVGLGRIGTAIAQRAAGLGMTVGWHGPRAKPDVPWPYFPSLIDLADWANVLILATPGGHATAAMVDAAVLDALGSTGWLVNVARGSVVDEPALLVALEGGRIAGAALDVFAVEPGLDPRFAALDNVVLSPHYASITAAARQEVIATILAAIDDWHDSPTGSAKPLA